MGALHMLRKGITYKEHNLWDDNETEHSKKQLYEGKELTVNLDDTAAVYDSEEILGDESFYKVKW